MIGVVWQAPVYRPNFQTTIRTFDPKAYFGFALDGHEQGQNEFVYRPASVQAILSSNLGPLSLRLRTELAGEAWHWNPEGSWSDPKRKQGYWTSSGRPGRAIRLSYGYRLPRRGNTIDQASNDGYSRLDDGDPSTFWKSNPYLDPLLGGEPYEKRPQWVVLDFGKPTKINRIRIRWGEPRASRYEIQVSEAKRVTDPESWRSWTGEATTRFLRVVLLSNDPSQVRSKDPRDRAGFAIREIDAGFVGPDGKYVEAVRKGKDKFAQTLVSVSSTDPWHRAIDRDPRIEEPGFDLLYRSGIAKGRSVMIPIGALYDTPENSLAMARWLRRRGYPIGSFEIGEEADGQSVDGETYAALYLRMADQIRKVFPRVPLGGPSFQSISTDFAFFPRDENPAWLQRAVSTIRAKGRMADLGFVSFEWYPFDDAAADPSEYLPRAPSVFARDLARMKETGMAGLPWIVTEYGYSAYGAEAEVTLPGAVFNVDFALQALAAGATGAYLYGAEPNEVIGEVPGAFGNNMMFLRDGDRLIKTPTYWSSWLLCHAAFGSPGTYRLGPPESPTRDLTAYPISDAKGRRKLLIVNRSAKRTVLTIAGAKRLGGLAYDSRDYAWKRDGLSGRPIKTKPPHPFRSSGTLGLEGYSITLIDEGL